MKCDIIEYIKYLFNYQSLKDILIGKNLYSNDISIQEYIDIENNHVI